MTCLASIDDVGGADVDLAHAEIEFVIPFLELANLLRAESRQMVLYVIFLFFGKFRRIL